MNSLWQRIRGRLRMTVSQLRGDCRFSLRLALYRLGDSLGGRLGLHRLSWHCNEKFHQWVLGYMKNKLQPLLKEYATAQQQGEYAENAPIWVCWWSGEETAPPLVRQCLASIRAGAGSHPVILVNEQNIGDYIQIPDYIRQKAERGQICLANLSDYIRVSLLEQWGGLWLDATIFCSGQVPELCFQHPIFTFRGEARKSKYFSQYRWVSFCLGGWKGNAFFSFLRQAWECYWQTEDYGIDYLVIDYIIGLGLMELPVAGSYWQVPVNHTHRDDLQAAMNARLPATDWDRVLRQDTPLNKLSWRESYHSHTPAGEATVYQHFMELAF